jgi:hypothetical protein
MELPVWEVRAEHQQYVAIEHRVVGRRKADQAGHSNVKWVVSFDMFLASERMHDGRFQAIGRRNAEGAFAPDRIRAPFTSTKIAPCSGSPAGVERSRRILNNNLGEARVIRCRARFPSPFIDKAHANIGVPRNLGRHRPRLLDRRQNPRPLFVTPATTALVACHQCHPTHAVQLASLLKPT